MRPTTNAGGLRLLGENAIARFFDDALYSVDRSGILMYDGRPCYIDGAPGVPIRVTFRELGPPAN